MRRQAIGTVIVAVGLAMMSTVMLTERGSTEEDIRLPAPGEAPAWLVPAPSFAGLVIHGSVHGYSFSVGTPDPGNGKLVTSEFWVEFGPDGTTIRSHEQFWLADGSLLQESIYVEGSITTLYGPGYAAVTPFNCVTANTNSPTPDSPPPFAASSDTLLRLGFAPSQVLAPSVPTTITPSNVRILQRYDSENGLIGWERHEDLGDGISNLRRLAVDETGRVAIAESRMSDATGTVVSESWQSFGSLDVIDPDTVLPSIFTLSDEATEACHE